MGDYDPEVGADLYHLVQLLAGKGDAAAIESLFEQAWVQREHAMMLPGDHPNRSGSSLLLGVLHMSKDELQEAEILLRECAAFRHDDLGEGHWMTHYAESVLGECLTKMQRFDEAEPLLLAAYRVIDAHHSWLSLRTNETLERIVHLYEAWGKPEEAAEHRERLNRSRGAG